MSKYPNYYNVKYLDIDRQNNGRYLDPGQSWSLQVAVSPVEQEQVCQPDTPILEQEPQPQLWAKAVYWL